MTTRIVKNLILPAVLLLAAACSGEKNAGEKTPEIIKPGYSHLFDTRKTDGGTLVTTYQPADTSKILRKYFLYKGEDIPADAPQDAVAVRIPLENVGCAHSTQIGLLAALGLEDRIKSVGSKGALEKNSALSGREDLGEFFNGWQFDPEKLLALNPDAVIFSPGRTENVSALEKDMRCPLILELSPWDNHPLARTEWMKFLAEFFDCREKADSVFTGIEARYNAVLEQGKNSSNHPKVLSSLPFQGVWYMPAGESYKSVLFREAGLDFPWKDTQDTGSLSLDMEAVLAQGANADVWFFETGLGASPTLESLKEQNKLYTHFKAYKDGAIFICNTDDVPYFEQGIVNPDKVLSDFVNLPRNKDYTPYYYRKIKDK